MLVRALAQPLLYITDIQFFDGGDMAENDVLEEAGSQGASAPARKNNKILVIVALALVLVGGGGAGAWFFLLAPAAPADDGTTTAAPARVVPTGPVQYMELQPSFIVNFPYQGRQRFLQASLTVMTRDPSALAAVTEHMPVIRHNLNNLFSAQMLSVAESPSSGIEALRNLATYEVQQVLLQEIGREGIEEVLFTAFVMQ